MAYSKRYTIDYGAEGTTVHDGVQYCDYNIDDLFTDLNAHADLTTGCHGVGTGVIVSTIGNQSLCNKTLISPTITGGTLTNPTLTGAVTASGATISGATITGGTVYSGILTGTLGAAVLSGVTLENPTLTGTVVIGGGSVDGGTLSNLTISDATLTGPIDASGATISEPTLSAATYVEYDTLWVPAGAIIPRTTSGPSTGTLETSTHDHNLDYLAFSSTVTEYADFNVVFPDLWDLGTFKAKLYWSPSGSTGTVDNTVEWGVKATALNNDDTIDAAAGTVQVVVDNLLAGENADLHITDATPEITPSGTPAAGCLVCFTLSRNPSGTDDYSLADAWLYGVLIQFKKNGKVTAW